MYLEFLEPLATYIRALNHAEASITEVPGLTPYVQHVPVLLDEDICGFLVDEVGGSYQYEAVTDAQRAWWAAMPR